MNRFEACFLCRFAEPVPWTNILADVTAKHPIIESLFHRIRYHHILQFDRKVGDAFTSINNPLVYYRFSRTRVYTPPAGAAIIFHQGVIRFKVKIGDEGSYEEE